MTTRNAGVQLLTSWNGPPDTFDITPLSSWVGLEDISGVRTRVQAELAALSSVMEGNCDGVILLCEEAPGLTRRHLIGRSIEWDGNLQAFNYSSSGEFIDPQQEITLSVGRKSNF